ncbi:Uncharacterised protein [Yersinia intermedia]|nr:Uncharacterised protein [Yersinia intermedia]CNH46477.1 Uncharacterised protein [Yersinia intermedia]CQJ64646.1 Uncharacterised protein [Yersinia intermedia]CRE59499.1 Uncharacterised protein [Yersinia intermedia]
MRLMTPMRLLKVIQVSESRAPAASSTQEISAPPAQRGGTYRRIPQ